jgi:hypothetical protein
VPAESLARKEGNDEGEVAQSTNSLEDIEYDREPQSELGIV